MISMRGRFLSVDPLFREFAWNSPYAFGENRVIDGKDLDGKEWEHMMASDKPGELKMKLPNNETAQIQYYSASIQGSKKTFEEFKTDFTNAPQNFLSNSKAKFNAPVDADGKPTQFKIGSYIKIDIDAPFSSGYVKVIALDDKKTGTISATFATMEGHIEKGIIRFGITDKGNGKIDFTITSLSEVDMWSAKTFKEETSREKQKESWNEALDNVVKYTGGKETKRESKVIENKAKDKGGK